MSKHDPSGRFINWALLARLQDQAAEVPVAERELFLEKNCPPELRTLLRESLNDDESPDDLILQQFARQAASLLASDEPAWAPGTRLLDAYTVRDAIDRGGMGEVYLVREDAFDRDLALKTIRTLYRDDADSLTRFVREARLTAQLQHPNIVPVHQHGTLEDGRPFFAMKLVRGRTLAEYLNDASHQERNGGSSEEKPAAAPQHQALSRNQLIDIVHRISETLGYAHQQGVVHRDVKPANVIIGDYGEVQLVDWGIAKQLNTKNQPDGSGLATGDEADDAFLSEHRALTRSGAVIGTWGYMAPEQAQGATAEVDQRADVFSLGAILCEVLTGAPPYRDRDALAPRRDSQGTAKKNELAGLQKLAELERRWREDSVPQASFQLIELTRRCLAVAPDERPPNAMKVAVAIEHYQQNLERELASAKEEQAAQQGRLVADRKRYRWSLAATALFGILVLGGAASGWTLTFLDAQRDQARFEAANSRARAEQERQRADSQEAQTLFAQGVRSATSHDPSAARDYFVHSLAKNDTPETRKWLADVWTLPLVAVAKRTLLTRTRQDGKLSAIDYLPDGSQLVVAGDLGEIRFFAPDPAQQDPLWTIPADSPVISLACSPDSKRIAFLTEQGSLEVWDLTRRSRLQEIDLRKLDLSATRCLAFGPRGNTLAVGGRGFGAVLLDAHSGDLLQRHRFHDTNINQIAFHDVQEPRWLLAGNRGVLQVRQDFSALDDFNARYGESGLLAVAADPATGRVAFAGTATNVEIYGAGEEASFRLTGHGDHVTAIAFPPGQDRLLTGGEDGTVRLWDLAKREQVAVIEGLKHAVSDISIHPEGGRFALATRGGELQIWQFAFGKRQFRATDTRLSAVAWINDNELLTTDWGSNVGLWNLSESAGPRRVGETCVLNANQIAGPTSDGEVYLADCLNATVIRKSLKEVQDVAPDPNRIVILSPTNDDDTVMAQIHAISPNGQPGFGRRTLAVDSIGAVVALAPSQKRLAMWIGTPDIELIELPQRGTDHPKVSVAEDAPVRAMAFSSDSKLLAVGGVDGKVKVWNVENRRQVSSFEHEDAIRAIVAVKDQGQQYFVTAAADRKIRMWSAASGESIWEIAGNAYSLAVRVGEADQQVLAIGHATGKVSLCAVAPHRQLFETPPAGWRITSLAFSPSGKTLAATGAEGTMELWDMEFLKPLRDSSPEELAAAVRERKLGPALQLAPPAWQTLLYRVRTLDERESGGELLETLDEVEATLDSWKTSADLTAFAYRHLVRQYRGLAAKFLVKGQREQDKAALRVAIQLANRLLGRQSSRGIQQDNELLLVRGQARESLGDWAAAANDYQSANVSGEAAFALARLSARIAQLPPEQRPADTLPAAGPTVIDPSLPLLPDPPGAPQTPRDPAKDRLLENAVNQLQNAVSTGFRNWERIFDEGVAAAVITHPRGAALLGEHVPPETILARATSALQAGNRELALQLSALCAAAPRRASEAHTLSGEIHLLDEDLAEALKEFDAALDANASNMQARYLRGQVYQRQQKWDQAEADYRAAIKLSQQIFPRGEVRYFVALGDLYRDQQDFTKALETYDQVLGVGNPDLARLHKLQCVAVWEATEAKEKSEQLVAQMFQEMKRYILDYPYSRDSIFKNRYFEKYRQDKRWQELKNVARENPPASLESLLNPRD